MESCDTNILFYYLNSDCPENKSSTKYFEKKFSDRNFAICELVLAELYVLLQNPTLIKSPMSANQAMQVIRNFRANPYWKLIDYPGGIMDEVWESAHKKDIKRTQIYDTRLAMTLKHHGIKTFATRNKKDFECFSFLNVVNPVQV